MQRNALNGSIEAKVFKGMTKLEEFDVSNNNLVGNFPSVLPSNLVTLYATIDVFVLLLVVTITAVVVSI